MRERARARWREGVGEQEERGGGCVGEKEGKREGEAWREGKGERGNARRQTRTQAHKQGEGAYLGRQEG